MGVPPAFVADSLLGMICFPLVQDSDRLGSSRGPHEKKHDGQYRSDKNEQDGKRCRSMNIKPVGQKARKSNGPRKCKDQSSEPKAVAPGQVSRQSDRSNRSHKYPDKQRETESSVMMLNELKLEIGDQVYEERSATDSECRKPRQRSAFPDSARTQPAYHYRILTPDCNQTLQSASKQVFDRNLKHLLGKDTELS